jgi:hypothetical protein
MLSVPQAGSSPAIGAVRSGRALARVCAPHLTPERFRGLGWHVDDLKDLVVPYADFRSFEAAKAAAAADLPPGTTVSWSTHDGRVAGGFIVGHDGLAPPLAGVVPAFVLWPDRSQDYVETVRQLAALLRERLDWLADLALTEGFRPNDVAAGHAAALRALDQLESNNGRLRPECCGPFFDVRCAALVEPVGRLRWDGFREGWDEPDGPPASDRLHPVHYEHAGDSLRVWRQAVAEGLNARRNLGD